MSSKEVVATLTELGVAVRSAQSSIDRDTAVRAAQVLLPDPGPDAAEIEIESDVDSETAQRRPPATSGGALAPIFNAPAPVFLPPSRKSSTADSEDFAASAAEGEAEPHQGEGDADRDGGGRRRRRRGRRGRGRGKGEGEGEGEGEGIEEDPTEQDDSTAQDTGDSEEQADDGDAEESDESTGRRRRRRRRRRNGGDDEATPREDDPPDTVVHVRETGQLRDTGHVRDTLDRPAEDEVQAVRGSTRLEAKRQRRRDGREAGRRRAPILSESEFLTRREAVVRSMVVREDPERTQIGVLEDDVLVEHFVTASGSGSLVGNVYLGKVQNVLPSMEAAVVDIGRGR
ncbi:MAG: ribonuclease E/G, partial [Actinomycetes bacterium]